MQSQKDRLTSWKEISLYFGRSLRTVKRWEIDRGLPVHRLPGHGRSAVYADVAELERWFKGVTTFQSELVVDLSKRRTVARRNIWWAGSVLSIMLVSVGVGFLAFNPWGTLTHRLPPAARARYLSGTEAWQRRTPTSLNAALDNFNQAIALDPRYAEAYAGLADAYNLMPEYTSMPTSTAYPKAEAAAEQALRLNPGLGAAHAALAFSLFWGRGDSVGAFREYRKALELNPDDANAAHWYATSLFSAGDPQGALTQINRALALDPDCLSIQADRGVILSAIDPKAALPVLKAIEAIHPEFLSPHTYLGYIYTKSGNDEDAVREVEAAAHLRGNPEELAVAEAARSGLNASGHEGMLRSMLRVRLDQFVHGRTSAYAIAQLYARLGEVDQALNYLKVAFDRHETETVNMKVDDAFVGLRHRTEFRALAARMQPIS